MLNLSQQLQRLIRIDRMIRQRATGNPEELAQRLGISRSMLYLLLQELKETFGCPLQYSRKERTFYYEQEGGLICRFEAKALSKETQRKTRGGKGFLGQWEKIFHFLLPSKNSRRKDLYLWAVKIFLTSKFLKR